MNKCFVIGYIISEVEFKFILNGKNNSISKFLLKLLNGSVIKIITYDDMADYCIQKLTPKMFISVSGVINSDINIIACKIEQINGNYIQKIKFLSL